MMHGIGEGTRQACSTCGSTTWHAMRTIVDNGELISRCSECSDPPQVGNVPDVYFDKPGTHHGICDDKTGKEIFITSKAHKAYEMKRLGLSEAGDRVRGSTGFDPISHRHAMASLLKPPPPIKGERK